MQKAWKLEFAHCFLINFTYAKCEVTFFIEHFVISPILYEGSTLINFGFQIKEDLIFGFNFRLIGLRGNTILAAKKTA